MLEQPCWVCCVRDQIWQASASVGCSYSQLGCLAMAQRLTCSQPSYPCQGQAMALIVRKKVMAGP